MSDTHSHTPEIEVPVLIVGAGPAGLVASLSLARHGVGHLTVEGTRRPHTRPGLTLSTSAPSRFCERWA